MFGFKLQSGGCGCGCGSTACIQQKIFSAETLGAANCGDMANAIDYINAYFSSVSPLSLAWAAHPAGWQYRYSVQFDAPGDTTPDPADTETSNAALDTDEEYPNASVVGYNGGEPGFATRVAFLLPDSTVQIVGSWQSGDNAYTEQQSCVMTGISTGCGYVFDIPIPPPSLCVSEETVTPSYSVFPNSNLGGFFPDFVWSAFVTMCEANPTTCGCSTSPGPCMSGDPFFGDEP